MTNLELGRRTGKRERLVGAARDLFHHRGVERTTLADIADAADVPLGNVYYYFKSKDEIVRAVIDSHADDLHTLLQVFDARATPQARLIAFTREVGATGSMVALHGCPHGSLCAELNKRGEDLAAAADALMRIRVDWAREQFRLMGRRDARDMALTFVARLQGAALLANTYADPAVLTSQTRHVERWINSLT